MTTDEEMLVERWTLPFDFAGPAMERSETGEFVRYSDHAAQVAELRAERDEARRAMTSQFEGNAKRVWVAMCNQAVKIGNDYRLRAEAAEKRLARVEAERDKAIAKWEDADGMDGAVVHAVREALNAHGVPLAPFIDDHVANAIVQRNHARDHRDRLVSALREIRADISLKHADYDGMDRSDLRYWMIAIDAALSGSDGGAK